MSYCITPFSVSIGQLQQIFGSHDTALALSLKHAFASRFERDEAEKDEDDEGEPSLEQTLDDIIEGKVLRAGYGHKYGYILEMLCERYGTFLPNAAFSGMVFEWAEDVDHALQTAGVLKAQFSLLDHLMYRCSPVKIPMPDDKPLIGYLKASEIGAAFRAVEAANLSALTPEQQEAIVELRGWLRACARLQSDLVCLYH